MERNFIEQIKTLTFLETASVIHGITNLYNNNNNRKRKIPAKILMYGFKIEKLRER